MVTWLMQGHGLDPMLGMAVQSIPVSQSAGKLSLYPTQLTAMQAFIQVMQKEQQVSATGESATTPIEIELIGPEGAGKRTLAARTRFHPAAPRLVLRVAVAVSV